MPYPVSPNSVQLNNSFKDSILPSRKSDLLVGFGFDGLKKIVGTIADSQQKHLPMLNEVRQAILENNNHAPPESRKPTSKITRSATQTTRAYPTNRRERIIPEHPVLAEAE